MLVGGLLLEVDNSKLIHLSSDSSMTFLVSPAVRTLLSVGAVSAWCFALRGEYQSKGWDPIFFSVTVESGTPQCVWFLHILGR